MKTLYLARHARAGDHSNLRDFERTLTEQGQKDARRTGEKLAERSTVIDLILTSPAYRTLATARILSDALGYPAEKIAMDKRIYEAEEKTLFHVLHEVDDAHQSVMLVGHNPAFTEFSNNVFRTMINSMATSGVVCGHLSVDSWKDVGWASGKMDFYIFPEE